MTRVQSEKLRDSWKRLSPEERRAQLIDVASTLFEARPYAEIGVVDVAKAAGITHGLIYHYFESKEALFSAAFEARAKELVDRCIADASLPLPVQVEVGVRGYLDFVETHRVAYLNLFRTVVPGHEAFQRMCEETRRTIIERFISAMGLTHLRLPATRLSLRGYVGFIETAVLEWLESRSIARKDLEHLIFAVVGTALRAGLTLDAEELDPAVIGSVFDAYDRYFAEGILRRSAGGGEG